MRDALSKLEEGFERKTLTALDAPVFLRLVGIVVLAFQTLRKIAQAHLTSITLSYVSLRTMANGAIIIVFADS